MAELVGGALLGAVFGELLSAVSKVKDHVIEFEPKMLELQGTLEALKPVIDDIEDLNKQLNRPDQSETEPLKKVMKEGTNLVCKCLHIRWWNILKKTRYHKKLMELDNKLLRFHIVHMQSHTAREVKIMSRNLNNLTNNFSDLCNNLSNHFQHRSISWSPDDSIRLASPSAMSVEDFFEEDEDDFTVIPRLIPRIVVRWAIRAERRSRHIVRAIACVILTSNAWEVMIATKMDNAVTLGTTIKQLKATTGSLFPVLLEIESNEKQVVNGGGQSETERVRRLMEEGKKLVRESSNIGWWNILKKWRYQKKIEEVDNKLLRFHSIRLQACMASNHTTTRNGS